MSLVWPRPETKSVRVGDKYGLQVVEWAYTGQLITYREASPVDEGSFGHEFLPTAKWALQPEYDRIEQLTDALVAYSGCDNSLWRVALGSRLGLYYLGYLKSDSGTRLSTADYTGETYLGYYRYPESPYSLQPGDSRLQPDLAGGFVLSVQYSSLEVDHHLYSPCHVIADQKHGVLGCDGSWWLKVNYDDVTILDSRRLHSRDHITPLLIGILGEKYHLVQIDIQDRPRLILQTKKLPKIHKRVLGLQGNSSALEDFESQQPGSPMRLR